MTLATFPERVAAKAVDVNVARLLLSIVAAPFYLLGLLLGLLLVVTKWGYGSVLLGIEDVRSRRVTSDAG